MNKPNRIIVALILAITAINVSAQTTKHQHHQPKKEVKMEQNTNKQVAINAVNALFRDYDVEGIKKYFAQDYIQHNPHVPTGIEPVIGFAPLLKKAGTTTQNHRMIADGDFVVMHNTYDNAEAFGARKVVTFDIFRIANGKVAEHWDAINPLVELTASGRTQVDGPIQITDLNKTQANKTLVKNFVDDVLFGKAPQKITEYINPNQYHQHNVGIKDGLDGLNEAIGQLIAQNNMFKYTKVHKVLGEGNFVVTVSEGEWNGKPQAFYDLFRVENNQIVEHWDVVQEIPAQMAHNNDMF
jgi:predicted SnoaL-like aldol condensation-catalyzing enzyme